MSKLNATQVKNLKAKSKLYKISDGNGLYLAITPKGGKSWRYDYSFKSKRKTHTYGKYPELSLQEARIKHLDTKRAISNGVAPNNLKTSMNIALNQPRETFSYFAEQWIDVKLNDKSESHRVRSTRILQNDLLPYLKDKPVYDIDTRLLRDVLNKIVERGTVDTAHRAKGVLSAVFKFAMLETDLKYDPTANLSYFLPSKQSVHYPTILEPYAIGQLLRAMDSYSGSPMVKTALLISPHLFQRPGEIRQMEWSEINWSKNQWEIPAKKMKMSNNHIVPLSKQVLEYLQYMLSFTSDSKYVFSHGLPSSKPLSDNGVRTALRALGYTKEMIVPHGFRSMARTLLDEELEFRVEWIEMQLAHRVRDLNGRAYNRTQYLEGRRDMMQTWSDYLEELKQI